MGYKGWRSGSADQDMDMLSLKCLLDILVKYVKGMSLKLEKTDLPAFSQAGGAPSYSLEHQPSSAQSFN